MIEQIRPTSKVALKQYCLMASNGDIDKASRLYDFLIKDMEDLPLFDAPQPTKMQQIKSDVSDAMQWITQNQEQIFIWADLFGGLFNKARNKGKASEVVDNVTSITTNPLPNING